MSYNAGPLDPIASLREALRGRYEIGREIGQGAFATVYLARDLKHERKVALKVLNADPKSDTGELRFVREIRMLARLQHPNILPLHDSGHIEALLYYVMPYVSGETLRDRIDRERHLPIEDAVCIAQEAADALAYAHGQGIIHRDIKPENILLSGPHAIVADFGIARAIDLAGIRQLTRPGVGSPGTPAYMAPEQLLGEGDIDSRADIYSLGCVLYEMITGQPPFAGSDGFVKRFTEAPPLPSKIGPAVPQWLDEIVSMMIARNPAERYPSASQLTRALTLALARQRSTPTNSPQIGKQPAASRSGGDNDLVAPVPVVQSAAKGRPSREPASVALDRGIIEPHHRRMLGWAQSHKAIAVSTVLAIMLIVAAATGRPQFLSAAFRPSSNVDSTRFVVLPFLGGDPLSKAAASRATDKLYNAFRAWEGLNLVPGPKVDEAIEQRGREPRTLTEAMSMARQLGAGQLIWGHVAAADGAARTRAELYDLRQPNTTAKEILLEGEEPQRYERAAIALLAPRGRPASAIGGDGQTHDYLAWSAYNQGHLALTRWDLPAAEEAFSTAIAKDPAFPAARVWLAQLREWKNPLAPESWREHAERAAATSEVMTQPDRLLSVALVGMANRRYPEACAAYRQLTQLDSLNFLGWYGLGECQSLDRAVLPDTKSPSGWRWRSSYHGAAMAFERAFQRNPGAHTLLNYQRLRRLLPITAVNPRIDDRGNPRFAALPSLTEADTVAFVPYPINLFQQGLPPAATVTLNQALNRNLETLFTLIRDWVASSPDNPDAYESLADILEARGDIAMSRDATLTAPAATLKALSLSTDPQQRLRLVVREARLRFKRGEYSAARAVADSVLASGSLTDENDPAVLIGLLALTGKVSAMGDQAKTRIVPEKLDGVAVPGALRTVAGRYFAHAALGACGPELVSLTRGLDTEIARSVSAEQRSKFRSALTTRPLEMMVPCTNGASALEITSTANRLSGLQQAYARGNIQELRQRFRAIARARRVYRPGDLSPDYAYQEAWLKAASGDTAAAIAQLDETLNAIPAMSASALREAGSAAAAVRIMAFRADLAAAAGDRENAQRWARAVSQLWSKADPPLQPLVARMNSLASQGR